MEGATIATSAKWQSRWQRTRLWQTRTYAELSLAAQDVLLPYAASRGLLVGLTIFLALLGHHSPFNLWNVLDARWYTGIALHGYHWTLDGKPALAFFPVYPLAIHVGVEAGIPAIAGALIIANAAALAALIYIRLLIKEVWGPDVAGRALWLFVLFPTAFFTFAPYTEALFILCAAATLYHAGRGQSLAAGMWFAAALGTRSTGVILIPPLLMSIAWTGRRRFILTFAPVLATVATYLVYLAWNRLPLSHLLTAQKYWHRSPTFPWEGFVTSGYFLAHHFSLNAGWTAENALQLGTTVLCLGATVAAWRSLPPLHVVYCAGFWVLVLCTPEWRDGYFAPFSSVDRFVLCLFPLVGWVASKIPPRQFAFWLTASAAVMAGAAAVHLSGGWVG